MAINGCSSEMALTGCPLMPQHDNCCLIRFYPVNSLIGNEVSV